ncbi:MAG: ABC transporter ATP-binding protein [Pseudomonadota bacterium]
MLEVAGLTVAYGQHRALEDAGLRVAAGEIVVILGANGAGKSTLLKAVAGICEGQVAGQVTLNGHDLTRLSPDRIVEEGVALVPEGRGIFGDLTVEENLTLGAYAARAREEEAANLARAYQLFPKLAERRRQTVRTMSGGEQQMVAIGRAMMSNPEILALDEPSLGLSPLLCKELFQSLRTVRDLGIGILLVEQNARQSLAIADRGYLLENAHIVHEATADALMHDPAVQAAYLGAGGAAAPHTHDEAPDAAAEVPPPIAVPPRPSETRSADQVLGLPVADLVARASAQRPEPAPEVQQRAATVAQDRLSTVLAEIEEAAARARTRRNGRAERPLNGAAEPPEPAASKPKPAVIEVYRAPRVEVYRRRPSGDFEREG